jgi:hypothetical protein
VSDETPKLPDTDSIQDLARFWDSHEVTAFDSELEEVAEPVFERASPPPGSRPQGWADDTASGE